MKAAPFAYHAPTTIDEAVELLESDGDVRVLAGGQSLMALMKMRRAKPRALVDINRVAGLDAIEERDGELVVGALVRQQTLLDDPLVARSWPLIREALGFVGHRATRHRGTVGGSLAFAASWAELTAVAVALDASIEARSRRGSRTIAAGDFFRGANETALERDELITAVRFPAPGPRTGSSFHEISARYRDYAQVGAAAVVGLDAGGSVQLGDARPPARGRRAAPRRHRRDRARLGARRRDARRGHGPHRHARSPGRHRGLRHLPATRRRRPRAPRAARRSRARRRIRGGIVTAPEHTTYPVRLEVNGSAREGSVEARRSLADFLREDLGLTGTHQACEHGFCGNCNVLLDGQSIRSCLMLAIQADGHSVETVEGLAEGDGTLSALQQAFTDNHGLQCGFCTPAMLMTAVEFMRAHPEGGSDDEIREAISGVTCRCTGYQQIVESIQAASQALVPGALEGGSR